MHGCRSGPALLINAEVDSMGGVIDGGVGIGTKTSPRRAAIEKAQSELRQEYDVREERRRELEFLEKGGNPLDFKFGHTTSVSVQSTSLADQHPEQIVTSEAKGSFSLAASPRGDSVESSGRPGPPRVCEPNSADNLLLFDGENEMLETERYSLPPSRKSSIAPSNHSQFDGSQNIKELVKSHAYKRRNRSRSNREGARSSSTDVVPSRGGNGTSLNVRHASRDTKGSISDINNQKDPNVSSLCNNSKSTSLNGDKVLKSATSNNDNNKNNMVDMQLDGTHAVDTASVLIKSGLPDGKLVNNVQESQIDMASGGPTLVGGSAQVVAAGVPVENGFSNSERERKNTLKEGKKDNAVSTKGLDSESSCTQTSLSMDGNNDNDLRNADTNGDTKEVNEGPPNGEAEEMTKEKNEPKPVDTAVVECNSGHQSYRGDISIVKVEEEFADNQVSKAESKPDDMVVDDSNSKKEIFCSVRPQGPMDSSIHELSDANLSERSSAAAPAIQTSSGNILKLENKTHEDSILEEARIIEAKRKRIVELSVGTVPFENRQKSQWDFVLEEMAWLANDFAQERIWKMTAAAQICRRVAFASSLRFEEQNLRRKEKKVAQTLANAVTQFWHSVIANCDDPSVKDPSKELELHCLQEKRAIAIRRYAVRFLEYNSTVPSGQVEAPTTPDRISDSSIPEMSWQDYLTEESLFYTIPPGAMEAYRKSIESHLVQCEKTGSSMQEEVETSMYDAVGENPYEEDEGETNTYYLPGGYEGIKSSKSSQKTKKNLARSYTARSYELGADVSYGQHFTENKLGAQQSALLGKRTANNLNVGSIPTKRVRTASRPRIVSPFSGGVQAPSKADASSGDTNSLQDDQSTLHGGSQIRKGLEVESVGDFEKQLPFDYTEISTKPKKKKKIKHPGPAYEQRWQLDSTVQNEQNSRKRLENHHFESNGSSGLVAQHTLKKPKLMKQTGDNSFDNIPSMTGSIPSPVASQMSNMSNPNKFIKLIGGRDRGRKTKATKIHAGPPGSGSPWTNFEDQALVVLVHDMGPNWELISDAINSSLQFKCIFRKPKECKERHKNLMDRTAGEGADSAEDSGSSQPSYPSTIPGIPKGSARQLFQRLQGPMEEDTLKSHFEKIIHIGQKHHYNRSQNDNRDMKQIVPVHSSHVSALSQVVPNNLNGVLLTPLDLCDTTSGPEHPVGYQGPHSSGLGIPNQGPVPIILPPGASSSLQGPSGMVLGSNSSSSPGPLNAPVRDSRYGLPRTNSSPIDEQQQRMQQYNHQMISGRSMHQPNMSVPGAVSGSDRGARMLPGANGMGMMCGMNRNMPMSRPGYPGIPSSSMLNSPSMISSASMVGIPNSVNMHPGAGSAQGNSMLRPRDALQMMRPGQNAEHQRQMMVPELQQGNGQGVPPFNGLSSGFSNQTVPLPGQTYPVHHPTQQPHGLASPHHPHIQGPNHNNNNSQQQQAYPYRFVKDKQIQHHQQQRMLQQQQQQQHQQQQFSSSGALMPHVQPQLQNTSQIPSQTSLPPTTPMTPISSQHQQKHHLPPHGLGRNPHTGGGGGGGGGGLTNQVGKQRQRPQQPQQFQQSSRQHIQQQQQQRQQPHTQQQTKLLKGLGRGNNMLMHQNLSLDPSHLNGQSTEKGDLPMHSMQGQGGLYPGSTVNSPGQPSKPPPLSQKPFPGQVPPLKQQPQMPSHSEYNSQGPPALQPPTSVPSSLMSHPHQKQAGAQRMLQQNRQVSSEPPSKSSLADQAQGDQQHHPNVSQTSNAVVAAVSSGSEPQWKAPEPVYDSSGLGNPTTMANSSGCDPLPPVSQGSGQLQSSDVGSQWHQPPQIQPPPLPHPPAPPQQQPQHLQAPQGSLYFRPSNSRLE